jgi:hypothetical protein
VNGWSTSREVEKPKPLEERAASAAAELNQLAEVAKQMFGSSTMVTVMRKGAGILQEVADGIEKRKRKRHGTSERGNDSVGETPGGRGHSEGSTGSDQNAG